MPSEKIKIKLSELTDMYDIENDNPKKEKKNDITEFEDFTIEEDAKYMENIDDS